MRVTVDFTRQHARDIGISVPELFDLRASDLFDEVAGVWPISANLTETDEPERVETALVDANYFPMLGIGPQSAGCSDRPTRNPESPRSR